MSGLINVPTYWPMWLNSEIRKFYYTSSDGSLEPIYSTFSYDPTSGSILYKDYNATGVWQDTWYYYAKNGYGIAEWRDDYPQTNSIQKAIFGPVKKVVMGEPIGWGQFLPIGGVYQNNPTFNAMKSCPPQFGDGWQYVKVEDLLSSYTTRHGDTYTDVLQFFYQQKWGNGKQTGARYWMAKNVGPVSIQWIGVNPQTGQPIESVRLDAIVTSDNQLIS
jgi:hypothetical protein